MKKIICLLAVCSVLILHSFAQEADLRRKVDTFMEKNKAGWDELSVQFADSTMIKRFRQHPFYKAYNQFLTDNGNQYFALRTARFRQYNPPPAALKTFEWKGAKGIEDIEQNGDLMSLAFVRYFDPGMPANIVMSILTPSISSDYNFPVSEMIKYYQRRAAFGTQLYVEPLAGDVWQVWCADHSFAYNFTYDLRYGKMAKLQYAQVQPIQWPASMAKPLDEAAALRAEETRALWDSYQPPKDNEKEMNYPAHQHYITGKFCEQNQARFIEVRTAQLKPFLQPKPTLAAGFKELTKPGDYLLRETDTLSNAWSFIYSEQWEMAIVMGAIDFYNLPGEELKKRLERRAILGAARYVQQVDDNRWSIWAIGDDDVIYYVWDLKSGYIDNIRYWVK